MFSFFFEDLGTYIVFFWLLLKFLYEYVKVSMDRKFEAHMHE